MNNRVNEIRNQIKALRVSMMEAEAAMRDQIAKDQECSLVASELLKMRAALGRLAAEKNALGNRDPIPFDATQRPRSKSMFVRANAESRTSGF